MLKILLIASILSLSSSSYAMANDYKINYFDKNNNTIQTEFYNNLDDLNERLATLNYNSEIFENIKISEIMSSEKAFNKKTTQKNIEQVTLIKRGGEGGGD